MAYHNYYQSVQSSGYQYGVGGPPTMPGGQPAYYPTMMMMPNVQQSQQGHPGPRYQSMPQQSQFRGGFVPGLQEAAPLQYQQQIIPVQPRGIQQILVPMLTSYKNNTTIKLPENFDNLNVPPCVRQELMPASQMQQSMEKRARRPLIIVNPKTGEVLNVVDAVKPSAAVQSPVVPPDDNSRDHDTSETTKEAAEYIESNCPDELFDTSSQLSDELEEETSEEPQPDDGYWKEGYASVVGSELPDETDELRVNVTGKNSAAIKALRQLGFHDVIDSIESAKNDTSVWCCLSPETRNNDGSSSNGGSKKRSKNK